LVCPQLLKFRPDTDVCGMKKKKEKEKKRKAEKGKREREREKGRLNRVS
jgi:hypothetical protein